MLKGADTEDLNRILKHTSHNPVFPLQRYVPATERARSELSLEGWIALELAVEKTLSWLRGNNVG